MPTIAQQMQGLDHIALELTDLAAGERFFGELLGFEERFRTTFEDRELVMLKAGKAEIELWQRQAEDRAPHDSARVVHHLGFAVKNLDQALQAARDAGVIVLVDVYTPTDGIREAIIEGPDGLRVQLVEQNIPRLIWRSLRGDFRQ